MKPNAVLNKRSSGLLLHPTSLPGSWPSGGIGPEADAFLDFLERAGQRWWQMLPIETPGFGGSPYQTVSAFAGSPGLIGLEELQQDGLLVSDELPRRPRHRLRADPCAAIRLKRGLLAAAWRRIQREERRDWMDRVEAFRRSHRDWLDDYALFSAIREQQRNRSWIEWPSPLRDRQPEAMRRASAELRESVELERFIQCVFARQWDDLRARCRRRGVLLLGDVPFLVALDSADVWANRTLFRLDAAGRPAVVAGVQPDYFSRNGQLWGHPLYDWSAQRRNGYAWWIARMRHALRRFDAVRLDHFIGFHRSWAVRAGAKTAREGRYLPGPGGAIFDRLGRSFGALPIVAEDLGVVTAEVRALRDRCGFPGMRVLQFAFDSDDGDNEHLPHRFPSGCVVYPGTHDNDTTVGWFRKCAKPVRDRVREYLGADPKTIHWALIRAAFVSPAATAVISVQDLLGLDSSARMNRPGKTSGNWVWRMPRAALTPALAGRLRRLAQLSGRLATEKEAHA